MIGNTNRVVVGSADFKDIPNAPVFNQTLNKLLLDSASWIVHDLLDFFFANLYGGISAAWYNGFGTEVRVIFFLDEYLPVVMGKSNEGQIHDDKIWNLTS